MSSPHSLTWPQYLLLSAFQQYVDSQLAAGAITQIQLDADSNYDNPSNPFKNCALRGCRLLWNKFVELVGMPMKLDFGSAVTRTTRDKVLRAAAYVMKNHGLGMTRY